MTTYDSTPGSDVKLTSIQASFSPNGILSSITGGQTIDASTTATMALQSAALNDFMQQFSTLDFDDLQPVTQSNGATLYTFVATIQNVDYYVYIDQAQLLNSIVLTPATVDAIQQVAQTYGIATTDTTITIDGVQYFVNMNIPLNFGFGQNSNQFINFGVYAVGTGVLAGVIAQVASKLGIAAFGQAFKGLTFGPFQAVWQVLSTSVRVIVTFATNFIRSFASTGGDVAAALTAGSDAAGDAFAGAMAGITWTSVALAAGGVLIIAVIWAVITFVLHNSYHRVYFYNLCASYDIALAFPYIDEGKLSTTLPTTTALAAAQVMSGPISLGTWYNGIAFGFESGSEFEGLGYTMSFQLMTAGTQNVVKTFACMFDVPFDGDNSLAASVSGVSDYQSFYENNEGVNTVNQVEMNDGSTEIIVTYDQLSGTQQDPNTGQTLYLYNSLVVIRDYPSSPSSSAEGAFAETARLVTSSWRTASVT